MIEHVFANICSEWYHDCMKLLLRDNPLYREMPDGRGAYMYHVECIDIHKTDAMYLYIDRACLCANNMYNVANFHIRNLMTGLKKDLSLRTENEKSVIRTFASSIPAVNFSLRLKHFVKIFRVFLDRSLSADTRRTKLSRVKYLQFSMPSAEKWFASYGLLDAVFRHTENTDYRSFHSHVIQNAINDCCEAWKGYFESRKAYTASSGHTAKPRIPGYRKSGGKSTAVFSNLACSIKDGRLFFPYAVVEAGKIAGEDAMLQYLDIEPGAVSIMGLTNDKEHHITLLIDEDILKDEYIGCHPCVCTSSLKLRTKDVIEKFLPATGHAYTTVHLVGED